MLRIRSSIRGKIGFSVASKSAEFFWFMLCDVADEITRDRFIPQWDYPCDIPQYEETVKGIYQPRARGKLCPRDKRPDIARLPA